MTAEANTPNLAADPDALWRMTGPIDHWLTTYNTGFWGLRRQDLGLWESLRVGDVVLFHATNQPTRPYLERLRAEGVPSEGLVGLSGYIGLGVVSGKRDKGNRPEWLTEMLGQDYWPLLVDFDPIVWFGDVDDIDADVPFKDRVSFDPADGSFVAGGIKGDLARLAANRWKVLGHRGGCRLQSRGDGFREPHQSPQRPRVPR